MERGHRFSVLYFSTYLCKSNFRITVIKKDRKCDTPHAFGPFFIPIILRLYRIILV